MSFGRRRGPAPGPSAEATTPDTTSEARTDARSGAKPTSEPAPRETKDEPDEPKGETGAKPAAGVAALRHRIANLVWLVAVVCALFLAVGALLIALDANYGNPIVEFIRRGANVVDLGIFSVDDGIFTFDGKNAVVENALVNWGIAAIAYLIVGKVVDRIIRP